MTEIIVQQKVITNLKELWIQYSQVCSIYVTYPNRIEWNICVNWFYLSILII